jgi:hypothetical protein
MSSRFRWAFIYQKIKAGLAGIDAGEKEEE